MRLAMTAAKFSADEADQLRKAMATFKTTGTVTRYRDKLVNGMVQRGYEPEFAERVFKQIDGFGSYGFPESHAASFAQLSYVSAWVKCHHPAVFACALLNSQPMGFYAPAQIVRDAREHQVEVRPVDVNASEWDCTLEGPLTSLALRLGLRLVTGLAETDAQAIVDARRARNGAPFSSVDDLAWRAGVDRRTLEALAAADAFAGLGTARRGAVWQSRGATNGPRQLPLFSPRPGAAAAMADEAPLQAEATACLPAETAGEQVVADYTATGLTLGQHPLALLRPRLKAAGLADTQRLFSARTGVWLRLAGLVLMRQRPGSAKGIIFITLEDEHGVANLVVYPDVSARDRTALVSGRLLVAEGRVEREVQHAEVPIVHLLVRRLVDRSELLDILARGDANAVCAANYPGHAKLPASRDFR